MQMRFAVSGTIELSPFTFVFVSLPFAQSQTLLRRKYHTLNKNLCDHNRHSLTRSSMYRSRLGCATSILTCVL
jgi:hypothetical protein